MNRPPCCTRSAWLRTSRSEIDRAIESPQISGLPLSVVAELSRNARYRATTQRNAVILGSHLHPLSLLIYGAELENITCLGHDHWLVSTVGRKLSLIGDSPFCERRGGPRVLPQRRAHAWRHGGSVDHRCLADRGGKRRQCDSALRREAAGRFGSRPT